MAGDLLRDDPSRFIAVLPQGTCGNTIHRLVTNIQKMLEPDIEVYVGDVLYQVLSGIIWLAKGVSLMTDLIGDPLFQLNLMLWLSLPQPAGGRITPILHDAGFKAHWISPKLTLSQEIAEKLRQKGIRSNQSVAPI